MHVYNKEELTSTNHPLTVLHIKHAREIFHDTLVSHEIKLKTTAWILILTFSAPMGPSRGDGVPHLPNPAFCYLTAL